jgi:predicted nucleic acid-binding protein
MGVVLDASVVVKWFIDEQESEAARGVLASGRRLLAPELLIAEVGNAAWRRARLGEIPLEQAVATAEQVGRSPIEFRPLAALARRAIEMAASLDHPIYDCFYLALAEQLDAMLVTADDRLLSRLQGTAWGQRGQSLAQFAQ